jgi:hypothetical protein
MNQRLEDLSGGNILSDFRDAPRGKMHLKASQFTVPSDDKPAVERPE